MEKPWHMLTPMRVILVSASSGGKDNFMPASWCFPLSFDPPLFGVAISPKRFTFGMVRESGEFVLNVPGAELKEKVEKYGRHSGRDCDKFAESGLTREKSEKVGAVSIKECLASIECKVVGEHEAGDHVVFVGRVQNIRERKNGKGLYQTGSAIVGL